MVNPSDVERLYKKMTQLATEIASLAGDATPLSVLAEDLTVAATRADKSASRLERCVLQAEIDNAAALVATQQQTLTDLQSRLATKPQN